MKLLPNNDPLVLSSEEEKHRQQPTTNAGIKGGEEAPKRTNSLEKQPQHDTEQQPPPPRTTNTKKEVSFSHVHVREYEPIWSTQKSPKTTVGGACPTTGPAISLSWKYQTAPTLDMDEYERQRPRRSSQQLHLSPTVRMERLVHWGYSRSKIQREMDDSQRHQEQTCSFWWTAVKALFSPTTLRRRRANTISPSLCDHPKTTRSRRSVTSHRQSSSSSSNTLRIALSQY
mmetsp:Transcript_13803/g.27759  ORF Transcript_13803/g.27759 Transcript_13803/m.27759 type:complete len:229 (-) Transcript_13803:184-870(-)|eukprot:scaffold6781_cov204-Amphora_coffeaeformis.AAC.23